MSQAPTSRTEFPIRIAGHLGPTIRGYRVQAGMSQEQIAKRLGISQQSYSRMERNAGSASMDSLLPVLSILGVEFILRKTEPINQRSDTPTW